MNNASWWAKKLTNDAPTAAPRQTYPPSQPSPPPRLPAQPPMAPRSAPNVQVTADNLAEAATLWQGGEGTRTETQNCPNCGSNLYFSRTNSGSQVAPRCYACGYTQGRPMQGVPS